MSAIHILHPQKTGGLSIRKALGCGCRHGVDHKHGETEIGTNGCIKKTSAGNFVCHGHKETCKNLPPDATYIMITRDPIKRANSWKKYDNGPKNYHYNNSLYQYMDCPNNPPAMILRTEHLDEDYDTFRKKFCKEGECSDLQHYHKSQDNEFVLTHEDMEKIKTAWKMDIEKFTKF